jgi:hypothetical protein
MAAVCFLPRWNRFRDSSHFFRYPVVYAATQLRPPATRCDPFGIMECAYVPDESRRSGKMCTSTWSTQSIDSGSP